MAQAIVMKPIMIDVDALKRLKSLSAVPQPALEMLAENLELHAVKRKTRMFEQDEPASHVYLLLKGVVKLSWVNHYLQRVLVTPLGKGEFFGVGSLYPDGHHPYRCEAVTDCTIATIEPQHVVEALLGISFETYLRGNGILTARIWNTFSRCIRGMGTPMRKRLALELINLGNSFGVQDGRGVIVAVRMTHEDLADSIGCSRQKVTETLADFETHGAIIRTGRRVILNMERLNELIA